jgi:hypothetical protein
MPPPFSGSQWAGFISVLLTKAGDHTDPRNRKELGPWSRPTETMERKFKKQPLSGPSSESNSMFTYCSSAVTYPSAHHAQECLTFSTGVLMQEMREWDPHAVTGKQDSGGKVQNWSQIQKVLQLFLTLARVLWVFYGCNVPPANWAANHLVSSYLLVSFSNEIIIEFTAMAHILTSHHFYWSVTSVVSSDYIPQAFEMLLLYAHINYHTLGNMCMTFCVKTFTYGLQQHSPPLPIYWGGNIQF